MQIKNTCIKNKQKMYADKVWGEKNNFGQANKAIYWYNEQYKDVTQAICD